MTTCLGRYIGLRKRARRGALMLSVAAMCAGALTACSGEVKAGDQKEEQSVASLPDASSAGAPDARQGTPSSAANEQGRPQLRLDSTDEEAEKLWDSYWACLESNGVKMNTGRGTGNEQAPPYDSGPNSYKPETAYKKCANKVPLQPPELDPDTNPDYADEYRSYVKCLNAAGMKVHALPDASGWTYDSDAGNPLSEQEERKADKRCSVEAFSDGKQ